MAIAGAMAGLGTGAFAQQQKPVPAPAAKASKGKSITSPADAAPKAPAGTVPKATAVTAPKTSAAAPKTSAADSAPASPGAPSPLTIPHRDSFDLTPDQAERFKKYLPKTYAKLMNRDPVHMVAIGDSVVDMFMYDESKNDWLQSYPAIFGKELAKQFFYTGGVRVVLPKSAQRKAEAVLSHLGPEITFRSLGRGGKLMIHAMQSLTTYGFENQPDIVTVSFGINDSTAGLSLATYARALKEVIETVRAGGAELILLGPTLTVDDPPEVSMGMTRPYVDTMREIAADGGVLFVDLGDLSSIVKVPETIDEPAAAFEQIVKQYRRFFNHGGTVDFIHPRPELPRLLGKRIYSELIDGRKAMPWTLKGGKATLESSDKFTLDYQIQNPSKSDISLSALPLIAGGWKPMDADPKLSLKAGETKSLKVAYARSDALKAKSPLPSHEPVLRLPILLSGAGSTRIEEVRAEARPCVLLWKLTTLFNQEKSFSLDNALCNTTTDALKGTWSAEWLGQKRNGDFNLAAGEKKPLGLSFDLPSASDPWRQTRPLTVEIAVAGLKLRFDRMIEISRNLGLKQYITLAPASASEKAPPLDSTATDKPGVRLKADADANALYLMYDISGVNLEDDSSPAGNGAFGFQLSLDARSYGKRLGSGAIDPLRLTGKAADGIYQFGNPQPWAFGMGYAAVFDPRYIKAQLSSTAGGMRRFTVTVPRNYLYLHEWAVGNGNSQLGIDTGIMFWKSSHEGGLPGEYPMDLSFMLLSNGRHRDDAESLAVLELTDKPTARWTVNPY